MNDNTTKLSGRKCWLKAALLFITILWAPTQLPAKGSILMADKWYIQYTLTVKGKGRKKPEPGKENIILDWSINRIYTGYAVLSFERKLKDGTTKYTSPDSDQVQVIIDERVRVFVGGNYQHDSWEDVTGLTNRKADTTVRVKGTVSLRIEGNKKIFLLDVGVKPIGTEKNGTEATQLIFDRSEMGLSGPPHEVRPGEPKKFAVADLWFPKEEIGSTYGLFFEDIVPTNYLSKWSFDSGPLGIAEPLIPSIPETKTDVKMQLKGRLSRTPLY